MQQAAHIDHLGGVRRNGAGRRLGRQVHVRQILLDQGGQHRIHVLGLRPAPPPMMAAVLVLLLLHRRTVARRGGRHRRRVGRVAATRPHCRRRLCARRPSAQRRAGRVPSKVRARTYVLVVGVLVVLDVVRLQLLIVEALLQRGGLLAAHALQHAAEHLAHAHAKVAAEEGVQQRIEGGI